MIANEGVLDAFGHVTMRHPADPNCYLMSRSRAPELVHPEDIHEFTLDSQIVKPIEQRLYGERVIHGEIYKARPDVVAVCHHHSPSILPFCISGAELKPVYHLGATLGEKVPFWDSRDEFGETALMRRHGATVVGKSLEELTFRTIYTARNAAMQIQAHTLGYVSPLTPKETVLAGEYNLKPGPVARAWEYWSVRLDKVEGTERARKPPQAAAPKRRPAAKSEHRR